MKKKIASILMCLSLLLGVVIVPAADAAEAAPYVDMLYALGLVEHTEEHTVTRIEFVKILARIMNYKNDTVLTAKKQVYADVQTWDDGAAELEYLTEGGVASGYQDGTFRPNDALNVEHASILMMRMLGYDRFIEVVDGARYVSLASQYGLLTGMAGTPDGLTLEQAARLVYNLMDTYMLTGTLEGQKFVYSKSDERVMGFYMELYEDRGTVTSDGIVDYINNTPVEGVTVIDGTAYASEGLDTAAYLGCDVRFIYRQPQKTDEKILVYVSVNTQAASILEIDDSDIVEYSDHTLRYSVGDREKTVKISDAVHLIYNHELVFDDTLLNVADGSIRLIRTTGSNTYDVAVIECFEVLRVTAIDTKKDIFYGKYNAQGAVDVQAVDCSAYERVELVTETGSEIGMDEISVGDVVLVYRAPAAKRNIKIAVVKNTVTEQVSYVRPVDSGYTLTIGGVEYSTVKGFLYEGLDINSLSGYTVTAFLNADGKIVFLQLGSDMAGSWRYGYVIRVRYSEEDERCILKLLKTDNTISNFVCDEKARINGERLKTQKELYNGLIADGKTEHGEQLIRFCLNSSGLISKIDTAEQLAATDISKRNDNINDCFYERIEGSLMYKVGANMLKRSTQQPLDGEVILDEDAVIFSVPRKESNMVFDDSDYEVVDALVDDMTYEVEAYNTSAQSLVQSVLVVYENKKNRDINWKQPFAMVKDVAYTVDEEDMVVCEICAYVNGAEVTYRAKDMEVINRGGEAPKRGDLIRVLQNKDNEVVAMDLVYREGSAFSKLSPLSPRYGASSSGNDLNSPRRAVLGKAKRISDGNLLFAYDAADMLDEFFRIRQANVCIYEKKANTVYMGTSGDILDASNGTGDKMIVCTNYANVENIFLIKE